MIIHTLGGKQTDSYAATRHYLDQKRIDGKIVLHPSFEEIYDQIAAFAGDYLLVPAAFRSQSGSSWGDLHYKYLTHLDLVDSFITKLDTMVVAKRSAPRAIAYSHAATASLLKSLLPSDVELRLAPSKVAAYQAFLHDGRYVLTSQKLLGSSLQDIQILKKLPAKMLWSLYRII
ncbi:hypothetical protein [Limosilactobacillus sp.]|uniref:hypothetical protein n=1 Tax=Limosilactobacillus sp. TaxID=2773925 RepID=UPI00345E96B9